MLFSLLVAALAGCDDGGKAAASTADEAAQGASATDTPVPAPLPKLSDDAYAELVQTAQAKLESGEAKGAELEAIRSDLRRVAADAEDLHLKANASLLLGALAEAASDRRSAISYYRQAQAWLPEEPSTHAVLALALAADGRYEDAQAVQKKLVELTPDDLQAWLIWGEMRFKAGDEAGAAEVYAGYEMRRKGLLDGLTLKKDGAYVSSEADRVGCVENLTAASDNGTALALLYALDSDPSTQVQTAIVELMGTQRLSGYVPALEAYKAKVEDPKAMELVDWALGEIARDGLDARPGGAPWTPSADAPAAATGAASETPAPTGAREGSPAAPPESPAGE